MKRLILLLFLAACSTNPYKSSEIPSEHVARGCGGAIATAHPLATEAGREVLQRGGNAVDAAVSASFVLSVTRPQSTGIGGGGFMLVNSDSGVVAYDFRERAPLDATKFMYVQNGEVLLDAASGEPLSVAGPYAAGVPGLVHGLYEVHQRYGVLPWKELLAPAIKYAGQGFELNDELESAVSRRRSLLEAYPDTGKIFFNNRKIIQKDLAQTLELIAEQGSDAFYKGELARKLSVGLLTPRDYAAYRTRQYNPVRSEVFGYEINSMPLPSSGGIHLVQKLNMVEQLMPDFGKASELEKIHLLTEISRRAFHDRATELGDPLYEDVNPERLSSKWYAALLAGSIRDYPMQSRQLPKTGSVLRESDSTTHLSVVDASGMAVASTQTINYGFGSGYIPRGTGVLLNNEMDDFTVAPGVPNSFGLYGSEKNFVEPGKTPLSSMTPTIVRDDQGRVIAALGSPDGPRIITAVFRVLLNYLVNGMDPGEAVFECRTHHQFLPDKIFVEDCLTQDMLEDLRRLGHEVETARRIGDVQAVFVEDGKFTSVSDVRSIGKPAVLGDCQ